MKLTPSQIETIELYLLSQELRDRDFYNEILDHFIVTLENKLEEGEEFDYAFPELTHEFANITTKSTWVAPTRYGLKGLESKYIHSNLINIKKNIFDLIKENISISTGIIWLAIVSLCAYFEYVKGINKIIPILMLIAFVIYLLSFVPLLWRNIPLLISYVKEWNRGLPMTLEANKFKQLGRYNEYFYHLHSFMFLTTLLNLQLYVFDLRDTPKELIIIVWLSFMLLYSLALFAKTLKKLLAK